MAAPGRLRGRRAVEDITIPDRGDGLRELESRFGPPAYVRRARQVQEALEALVDHCRRQRAERLEMVRLRVGLAHALGGGWDALRPLLADDGQVEALRRLHAELAPRLRAPIEPTSYAAVLRAALRELGESIGRFNRRWVEFLAGLDVRRVNELRDGYNRYYLLEKECALRSPRLARQGFRPLPPLTVAELEGLMPPLPQLRLRHQ
jgi:hypothetical protein